MLATGLATLLWLAVCFKTSDNIIRGINKKWKKTSHDNEIKSRNSENATSDQTDITAQYQVMMERHHVIQNTSCDHKNLSRDTKVH